MAGLNESRRAAADDGFLRRGWRRFEHDPRLARWIDATLAAARAAVTAPENRRWLRCGGTWFAGVNALGNDATGAVPGAPALEGVAVDYIADVLGHANVDWDRAQVSVAYPGYPRPMPSESATAFRYRRERDAAHLDGLLPEGPERRRHLRQYHAFLLGIPMVATDAGAAPFVVYEGSHEIIRRRFADLFAGLAPGNWDEVDATEVYRATRHEIFADCERVELNARPGESYLVHRLALHGFAPWSPAAKGGPDGRMIVYFRPELLTAQAWLTAP